jgi:mycothiol synthase
MDNSPIFNSRPYRDSDLQALCDLLNICSAVDKLEEHITPEQMARHLASPLIDRYNDQRVWEDSDGRVMAVVEVWILPFESNIESRFNFRVHPDVRATNIGSDLIAWVTEHTREAAHKQGLPAVLAGRVAEHDAYSTGVLEKHGFRIVRYGFRMARPLDEPLPAPVFPEGYTLSHVQTEEDVERWVDCFNHSFIDHWGFFPTTVEQHKLNMEGPDYKPEQDLVAVAPDGTFAAFCYCSIDNAGNTQREKSEGWINVLGTRRGHRHKGLGRAMLLAGLQHLKDAGADVAKLGVDAENPTGALGLYERTGFQKAATRVSYFKDV